MGLAPTPSGLGTPRHTCLGGKDSSVDLDYMPPVFRFM